MHTSPRPATPFAAALAALVLLGSCESFEAVAPGSALPGDRQDVGWLVDHGEFVEALRLAETRSRKNPDDPAATEAYRVASVALLLERGRRDLFADRDREALAGFERAQGLAPEDPIVAEWVLITRKKLARRWEHEASGLHIADDLHGAIEAYERSLEYDPEYSHARHGLARALLQVNHRRGMGEKYYRDGVAAFHDLWLEQARSSFQYSLKYTPGDQRARDRHDETQEQLAMQRVTLGTQFEAEGSFPAARNEYRMALLLDDDNAIALEGLARMTVETAALNHVRDAERAFMAGNYDEAVEAVDRARAMSEALDTRCDDLEIAIGEARLGDLYDVARVFEEDQRFGEAVAAYASLLEEAPYFRDTIARKETLEDYVAEAERLYAEAAAAESPEVEASLLRRIAIFWPEYLDVDRRLTQLGDGPNP